MSYELFEIPEGYQTDLVLVIAPYYCNKFVGELVTRLQPKSIRLVIDDSVRAEEIQTLKKSCGKKADVKIALSSAPGLVHLKGFYLEFVKCEGREQRKRRFLFGSANATEAAFGGKTNAELIADVELYASADRDLLDYFASVVVAVENGGGRINAMECDALRNSPRLLLPSFNLSKLDYPPGFDSWLQRGYLVAKYREPQQFMTVSITLKKRLPQGHIAKTFAGRQLIEQGERNVVRFAYSGEAIVSDDDADEITPRWKSRYCVWTHLGDWVSDDCFRVHRKKMRSKSSEIRKEKISELRKRAEDEAWKNERKNIFLNTLDSVWKDLQDEKIDPLNYLEGFPEGLNRAKYGDKFEKKLAADIIYACDEAFCTRYINGFEFPSTPRFRQDTSAWDEFAKSWCESIMVESTKTKKLSLLAKVFLDITKTFDYALDGQKPEDVLSFLRKNWNEKADRDYEDSIGELIEAYFKGD